MTEVTAHSPALIAYARGQQAAADDVGAHATRHRGTIGELLTTFGVIGADFLAATAYVLDERADGLDALAARHAGQDQRTRAAANRYGQADDAGAAELTSAATDLRLRL